LSPEQQQAQRAFAHASGLPVHEPGRPQSYEARVCDSCEGHGRRDEFAPDPCNDCDGLGRTVVLRSVQDGGELLAQSVTLLAMHLRALGINDLQCTKPELPGWLLDRLALHAYAAEQLARRDQQHVVELTAALELERQRYEEQGARMRKERDAARDERDELERKLEHAHQAECCAEYATGSGMHADECPWEIATARAADLAALHHHTRQLSSENEELRSDVGALRVEAEASRAAVADAQQAVLDAGVELSSVRAERDAIAAAHGFLVVESMRLKIKALDAAETIEKLNAELLQRMSARGVA